MRKFGILAIPPPSRRMPRWVETVQMLYFLAMVVEFSSETSYSTFNSTEKGRALHQRSKIDDHGAKISHYYHFSVPGRDGALSVFCGRSGAVWRDRALPKRSRARHEANESQQWAGCGYHSRYARLWRFLEPFTNATHSCGSEVGTY